MLAVYAFLKLEAICCSREVSRLVILYLVTTLLAATTSIWTLILQWRPADSQGSWALFFCSLTVTLISLEVYFWKVHNDGINDPYAKLRMIDQYRDAGVPAMPSVGAPMLLGLGKNTADNHFLPLGGVSDVTTVFCNENGYMVTYPSDEHGFNNQKGIFRHGSVDVALVGDSFTEGACVWPSENLASILTRNGYRTINLGRQASGPLVELAITIEYVPVIRPKVLVWMYYEDLAELEEESEQPMLMRYLNDEEFSQDLIHRQEEIDDYLIAEIEKKETQVRADLDMRYKATVAASKLFKLYHLRKAFGLVRLAPTTDFSCPNSTDKRYDRLISVLKRAKKVVNEWDGTLVFVNLPSWSRLLNQDREDAQRCTEEYQEFGERLASIGIYYYDALQFFANANNNPEAYFALSRPNHYSPVGYRLLGSAIADILETDGLME